MVSSWGKRTYDYVGHRPVALIKNKFERDFYPITELPSDLTCYNSSVGLIVCRNCSSDPPDTGKPIGSGFLCSLKINDTEIVGVVTAAHVIRSCQHKLVNSKMRILMLFSPTTEGDPLGGTLKERLTYPINISQEF